MHCSTLRCFAARASWSVSCVVWLVVSSFASTQVHEIGPTVKYQQITELLSRRVFIDRIKPPVGSRRILCLKNQRYTPVAVHPTWDQSVLMDTCTITQVLDGGPCGVVVDQRTDPLSPLVNLSPRGCGGHSGLQVVWRPPPTTSMPTKQLSGASCQRDSTSNVLGH